VQPVAELSVRLNDEQSDAPGPGIAFDRVTVEVRGRSILSDVDLSIRSGEHVAIVGRSGAGKSTFIGLLLGWHMPTSGAITIDHLPFEGDLIGDLRRRTAWVDPAVQLWNRSLFDNLKYGDEGALISSIASIVDGADLGEILEKLPAGLQSPLGEGGRLTSGGEGQRIRFGRALVRHGVRLALLDEPFRGLDRSRRHDLLQRAREAWQHQTLLCVTHDIEETLSFPRVLVLDQGRIVEDGSPIVLAGTPESAYAQLLAAERAVRTELWADSRWRRWHLEDGSINESVVQVEPSCTTDRQSSLGR
jgi:ABC-type multidrug transport system fused ATPase/permease subunit